MRFVCKLLMLIEHFLKALALLSDLFRGVPREQCEGAHGFEDAQHLVVRAEGSGMREDTIVCGLQLIRDKASERVEQRRLSR